MFARAAFAAVIAAGAAQLAPSRARAQPAAAESGSYRSVGNADLLGGYIPHGTLVESVGHLAHRDGRTYFNVDRISARYPMLVDVANVPPEQVRRMRAQCASKGITEGGCCATVRGEVKPVEGRAGIVAHAIEVRPGADSLSCG